MKKLIIAVLVLGAIVGGYFYVLWYVRAPMSWLAGKKATAVLGDLEVPITASGHIRPKSVTNVKSEASGEVQGIFFGLGDMVEKDELIIRLDPSDEERNVERADAELKQAQVAWSLSKLDAEQARDVGVLLADAQFKQAKARYDMTKREFDYLDLQADATGSASDKELGDAKSYMEEAEAQKDAAVAEKSKANITVLMAAEKIKSAEQNKNAMERLLEDAKERLDETEVKAPEAGMVVARHVQEGELVMSGTTSLTGGTVLMEIADVSEIYAEVNVDEADIGLVRSLAPESALPGREATTRPDDAPKPLRELPEGVIETGQRVKVTVEAYPDDTFYGVIDQISPQSEVIRAIATFKVRIKITSPNRDKLTRVLNTQAQAKFTAKSVRNAILVDYEAMKPNPEGDGYGVYVPYRPPGESKVEHKFVPCEFGVDNRVQVEVKKGLKEGQIVYTELPKKTRKEQKAEDEAEDQE